MRTISGMQIAMLSYPEVSSENLHSFRAAAARLGIELLEIEPHRLACWAEKNKREVLLDGEPFTPEALIHRTVSKVFNTVKPALQILAERGSYVLNNPESSWESRDKLLTALSLSRAGVPFVATLGLEGGRDARFPENTELIITKPALGLRGIDVVKHPSTKDALEHLKNLPWRGAGNHMIAQRLAGDSGEDLRGYVVDKKCVGMMKRRAAPGEFRANLSQGGTGETTNNPEAEKLAVQACEALGLECAGVDIIETDEGLQVLEIDAWAGFAGLEKTCQIDVSGTILGYVRERAR